VRRGPREGRLATLKRHWSSRPGSPEAAGRSLNIRIDYRRNLGPVDLVGFLDVINVYGGPSGGSRVFDPRRGVNVADTGEALPIIGLILERSW